jgi:hypothetical protein
MILLDVPLRLCFIHLCVGVVACYACSEGSFTGSSAVRLQSRACLRARFRFTFSMVAIHTRCCVTGLANRLQVLFAWRIRESNWQHCLSVVWTGHVCSDDWADRFVSNSCWMDLRASSIAGDFDVRNFEFFTCARCFSPLDSMSSVHHGPVYASIWQLAMHPLPIRHVCAQ